MQGLYGGGSAGKDGSYAAALEAVAVGLDRLGVNRSDYAQADGSGLSRHNLITPTALVQVLLAMGGGAYAGDPGVDPDVPMHSIHAPHGASIGAQWKQLLPLAGRTGTLSNRFVGTSLEGVLRAKTGTVSGVSALSGYVYGCTFAMVVNNAPVHAAVLRAGLDDIALAFGASTGCGPG
jgi:D-alanyl-D-alanine carboxypeptidase/D-alanyl-D-alanine-endopeptidase (penicillin-binding protein 4)